MRMPLTVEVISGSSRWPMVMLATWDRFSTKPTTLKAARAGHRAPRPPNHSSRARKGRKASCEKMNRVRGRTRRAITPDTSAEEAPASW
jgi:hypothetical protein